MRYSENDFKNAIIKSFSIAEVCRQLNIRPNGGNYKTIHNQIKKYDVDISHFTGQGWNVGLKVKPIKALSINDILIENSTYSSFKLKNRLFDNNLKEEKCEQCGNVAWNGEKIPLELHHINGINTDNRFENLKILCCNCHAQTNNYRRGKSALSDLRLEKYKKVKSDIFCNTTNSENVDTPQNKKRKSSKCEKVCSVCGEGLLNNRNKFCSRECYNIATKGNRPNVFELIENFKELKSFVQVGKFYNVSDNAVRKWCEFYNITNIVK